jgi:uncharacterized protein (DUF433 family)
LIFKKSPALMSLDLSDYLGLHSSVNVELLKRVTIESGKCGGRPCIRGLRMRVTDVLQLLSAGASHNEILQDYPDLENDDILAAIEYAAHQTDHVVLHGT